jgi:cytidylate kinase
MPLGAERKEMLIRKDEGEIMISSIGQAGNVIISGLTAAGKSTEARLLVQEYGFNYLSASQTMLKLAGLARQQATDFWVTPKGLQLIRRFAWSDVDEEIRRVEKQSCNTVFDCLSLPWLHTKKCMVIWLESSLPSRVMKAVVSHQGQNDLTVDQVEHRINLKDQLARHRIQTQYGVDISSDRSPFNLIVDVSSLITTATEESARRGISQTHQIIANAVGWYLYQSRVCWQRFQACLRLYGRQVIKRYPKKSFFHLYSDGSDLSDSLASADWLLQRVNTPRREMNKERKHVAKRE